MPQAVDVRNDSPCHMVSLSFRALYREGVLVCSLGRGEAAMQ